MKSILGITAIASEELPDDIQHTKERKPDVLKRVTDNQGNIFVLQIEFQVADEPDMIYRMAEYHVMLERKYRLPVRQFVIFLGSVQPEMATRLNSAQMKFNFPLIWFAQLDYQLFLRSDRPEEVILGILADFKGENPEQALRHILRRVEETADTDFSLQRLFNQLRVLAQLRKLEVTLKNAMDSIAKYINEEQDVLYLRGRDKEKEEVVGNMIQKLNLSFEQIADIVGVSVEFVKIIQRKLAQGK